MAHPYVPDKSSVHVIHLPSKSDVENHLDNHVTSLEYADIISLMRKGIDAQISMNIILNTACDEIVPEKAAATVLEGDEQ